MPNVHKPQASQHRIIDFLDLGPGEGERLHMLSTAKKARRLVGIDIRPRPELLSGNKCVEWIQGRAENKLKDIPDGSVRVVNSDMFVPSFLGEENVDTTAKSLPEIKRVLAENGRFYATTRWDQTDIAKAILRSMGFRVKRRLLEEGDTFTGDTAHAMSMVYRYGWPHTVMPVRMVAIKRAEKK